MSSNNLTYLAEKLQDAESSLANFVEEIGIDFGSENMDRIKVLQSIVVSAREDLEAASAAETQPTIGETSETGGTYVNFVGTGKGENANIEIPNGTTVGKALSILAGMYPDSWGHVADQSKIRVQRWTDTQRIDIHDPDKAMVTGESCRIWVGNKVAGGSI